MKNASVSNALILGVLYLVAAASFAQEAAKPPAGVAESATTLPASFKGEWNGTADNFRPVSHVLEIQITSQSPDGKGYR